MVLNLCEINDNNRKNAQRGTFANYLKNAGY